VAAFPAPEARIAGAGRRASWGFCGDLGAGTKRRGRRSALSREAGDHLAVVCNPNHPFPVENASQAEREVAIGEDIRWRRKRLVAHFAFPLSSPSASPRARRRS
jgi:hypothetical protein